MVVKRVATVLAAVLCTAWAAAGVITVTSPAKGTAAAPTPVKATTLVNFNITGGQTEVTVKVTLFRLDTGAQYRPPKEVKVTPNTDGKVSGSVTITFSKGIDPEITYRAEVRAVEPSSPGNVYNVDQDLFMRPDLTAPKILQFNPLQSAAVKGTVKVTVQIQEANLKDWRVQIDSADLPNGEGTTVDTQGRFSVDWDTSGVQFDGAKTITIRVRDTADNETTQSIGVQVDRIKPTVTIATPQNNAIFSPGTTLTVVVDIKEIAQNVTGVDVVLRTTAGKFIARVSRNSFLTPGQTGVTNTWRWIGRVRWRAGFLPSQFKLVANAIDRAGNAAAAQSVTVKIGG